MVCYFWFFIKQVTFSHKIVINSQSFFDSFAVIHTFSMRRLKLREVCVCLMLTNTYTRVIYQYQWWFRQREIYILETHKKLNIRCCVSSVYGLKAFCTTIELICFMCLPHSFKDISHHFLPRFRSVSLEKMRLFVSPCRKTWNFWAVIREHYDEGKWE